MIRKELVDKFKKLYRDKYNIVLSDEESTELATHFVNLIDILIHPKKSKTETYLKPLDENKYEVGRI